MFRDVFISFSKKGGNASPPTDQQNNDDAIIIDRWNELPLNLVELGSSTYNRQDQLFIRRHLNNILQTLFK